MQCDAVAIRELCESRDTCDDLMFHRSELHIFIETLCTWARAKKIVGGGGKPKNAPPPPIRTRIGTTRIKRPPQGEKDHPLEKKVDKRSPTWKKRPPHKE